MPWPGLCAHEIPNFLGCFSENITCTFCMLRCFCFLWCLSFFQRKLILRGVHTDVYTDNDFLSTWYITSVVHGMNFYSEAVYASKCGFPSFKLSNNEHLIKTCLCCRSASDACCCCIFVALRIPIVQRTTKLYNAYET